MLWVDTIDRVGNGSKRHIYETTHSEKQSQDGGEVYRRKCGQPDEDAGSHGTRQSDALERVEAAEFALDDNACLNCLQCADLLAYREQNSVRDDGGAETVEYDPFGVFADES